MLGSPNAIFASIACQLKFRLRSSAFSTRLFPHSRKDLLLSYSAEAGSKTGTVGRMDHQGCTSAARLRISPGVIAPAAAMADRANISARLMVSSNDNARNTDDEDAAERPDPIALLRRLIRDY